MRQRNDVKILNEDKVQPHDIDTEQSVLATLMRYNEKYEEYGDILSDSLFYYDKEKAIYRCIAGVIGGGGITDINSLNDYAQRNDVGFELNREYFLEIISFVSKQTIGQDIERLRELSKRRRYWLLFQQAAQKVLDVTLDFDDEVDGVMTTVGELQAEVGNGKEQSMKDAIDGVRKIVEQNKNGGRQSLVTGIRLFDDYYLLRPNTMTVIAAFTSVGKSALALNIAMNVAKQDIPVAYYSLEMGKEELAARGISKAVNLSASVITNRQLTDKEVETFNGVADMYSQLPIYFDDSCMSSFDKTVRSIRRMVKTKKIRLAIIDYLQIYSQVSDDAEESISYMSRAAKNVAKETGIPVVVLSQLNRSALHPSIKMLRGSGQIEESADNIVLIDRPDAYPDNKVTKYEGEFKDCPVKGTAKLILAKGRGVGTGCDLMMFDAKYTTFSERVEQTAEKPYEHDDVLPF